MSALWIEEDDELPLREIFSKMVCYRGKSESPDRERRQKTLTKIFAGNTPKGYNLF